MAWDARIAAATLPLPTLGEYRRRRPSQAASAVTQSEGASSRDAARCFPSVEAIVTPSELRILDQMRRGLNHIQIAAESSHSVHTARTISRNLRAKFGARNVRDLLHGLELGIYRIRRRPSPETPTCGLPSALRALERELRRGEGKSVVRTLRLRHDEIDAILRLAQAHHALLTRGNKISTDLRTIVGDIEGLMSTIQDERNALAAAVGHQLGLADAERGTLRSVALLDRIGGVFGANPIPLRGADRTRVVTSFRDSYVLGHREHEYKKRRRMPVRPHRRISN